MPFYTALEEQRYDGVKIVKPMRDCAAKEVALFDHYRNLSFCSLPTFHTAQARDASIEKLVSSFLVGLDTQFPSTINIVARTTSKLTSNDVTETRCTLCAMSIKPSVLEHSVLVGGLEDAVSSLCYGCQRLAKDTTSTTQIVDLLSAFHNHDKVERRRLGIEDYFIE